MNEPADPAPAMKIEVGKRYHTKRGTGTCIQITPYQVAIDPEDGEEPFWVAHSAVLEEAIEDTVDAPLTLKDLVDQLAMLVSQVKEIVDAAFAEEQEQQPDAQQPEASVVTLTKLQNRNL